MMGKILSEIQDPADYVSALELLKTADKPPTAEQTEKLLNLYAKYLPSNPDTARLCLAVDLLFEQGEDHLAALELQEADSNMLLELQDLMDQKTELTEDQTGRIIAMVKDGGADETLRTVLARAALDMAANSWNYQVLREQILELADFLIGRSTEILDRGTTILRGVRSLCRRM